LLQTEKRLRLLQTEEAAKEHESLAGGDARNGTKSKTNFYKRRRINLRRDRI
jgi:hypothetical protein